ncbi:MAG: glycosyl transferase [Gemmatimonadaceae bacterium]
MTAHPADHVLSNGRGYEVRITSAGGGRSTFGALALTRRVPDRTRDADGFFIYVRDLESATYWSTGQQPVRRAADRYEVRAGPDRVTITREDDGIETTLDVRVLAGDDVELRRITLVNRSGRARRLDVTTYAEVVLNTPDGDASHPAFSKLFVQTERDAPCDALLAMRRLRSPDDEPLWLVHALRADNGSTAGAAEWETDRRRFLGRGRTPASPAAMDAGATLSGTTGNVLDPIVSMRRVVILPPGATANLMAVLGAARDREGAERIASQYGAARVAGERWDDADRGSVVSGGSVDGDTFPAGGPPREPLRFRPDSLAALDAPTAPPPAESLRFFNGIGGFSDDGTEYVVRMPVGPDGPRWPPLPWTNVVANETIGFIASESGAGNSWSVNSRENRLTPWLNDPVSDTHVEALYLRDEDAGVFWSPTPGPVPAAAPYESRHGFGYSVWRHTSHDLEQELVAFVPRRDAVKILRLRLRNTSARARRLTLFSYAQLVLGVSPWDSGPHVVTERDAATGAILATNAERGEFAQRIAFAAVASDAAPVASSATANRQSFLGRHGSVADPAALFVDGPLDGRTGAGLDPCAAFQYTLALQPGSSAECIVLLGESESADGARALVRRYGDAAAVDAALADVRAYWTTTVGGVHIETPSPDIDLMVNGWLTYQNLGCRVWGRSAFYQSGGAFGFRDQLQDTSALVYLDPAITRAQIVLHAAHQFVEGDVMHWWHPPLSKGIRTRFSDDLLWLPYITAFYVARTGDDAVLDAQAPFLTARPLEAGEDEVFLVPTDSGLEASVFEHCCRAIDRSLTEGVHGLPLMGTGDWNDGMNRVGREGRGESVWLGFFLFGILEDFIPLCDARGDQSRAAQYREYRRELGRALNDTGWDGAWYRRAYYDDGTPLGSAENDECRIDTLAQAWAVLAGAAPPDRATQALDAMEQHLVSEREGLIRLLTPAFDKTQHDPGYIKGYLPGVRENGGQYTHGALWGVRALAEAGRTERAARLLAMLSPVSHGRTPEEVAIYQAEPYVIAADVYGVEPHVGRGGWTWYTGSAGWMFRVALESVLGFTLVRGETIEMRPCIPAAWPGFTLRYRIPGGETVYSIRLTRSGGATAGVLDGRALIVARGAVIVPIADDGTEHTVEITLGPDVVARYVPRLELPAAGA